ncbi:MAG: hypothetical protein AB200_03040 [Parcubacteria bacterium C7867-005]|nr:MAG: hypothetical protein AB200_03040 [Parcubacteria bacterium C7867-005]
MKKVILVHGWDGSPQNDWFPWAAKELNKMGYDVVVPLMPNPARPEIESWLNKLSDVVGDVDEETVFIGHSIGCQAVLRFMERLEKHKKVSKIILVAPWMALDEETIKEEGEESIEISKPWIETPIDFNKVKIHADKFVALFSDDDPFVPLNQKDVFDKALSAKIMVQHGMGHFTQSDNVYDLPIILDLVSVQG